MITLLLPVGTHGQSVNARGLVVWRVVTATKWTA